MPAKPYSHFFLYFSQPKSKPSLSLRVHLVFRPAITPPALPFHTRANLVPLHWHFCWPVAATQPICPSLARQALVISKRTPHIWQREREDIWWTSHCLWLLCPLWQCKPSMSTSNCMHWVHVSPASPAGLAHAAISFCSCESFIFFPIMSPHSPDW